MQRLPLLTQTAYAELVERCATADLEQAFGEAGAFTAKTVKGRRYWYFQANTEQGRKQRYVGPETDALLERIAKHRQWQDDRRERRALISTLLRTAGVPQPNAEMGAVVAALAKSGVFRRRAVLIGTVAYHTYAPMLGVKLSDVAIATDDIDIAQDLAISISVEEEAPALLNELKSTNPEFQSVPSLQTPYSVAYRSPRLRVDILTTNRGADSDKPVYLPALGSDGLPLRFVDFLIRDPVPAVLLYEDGVYVAVPTPARYAIQKLIVSGRRKVSPAKSRKDLEQAENLLEALAAVQRTELLDVWGEAWARGDTWQGGMTKGLSQIKARTRDFVLQTLNWTRSKIEVPPLTFEEVRPIHIFDRDIVVLRAKSGTDAVTVAISREALDDHFGADRRGREGRIDATRKCRSEIEALAALKYMDWPIEDLEMTLLKTTDIEALRAQLAASRNGKIS